MDWNDLESACADCRKCGLCERRHNVVFGVGRKDADVMLIGEGPGEQEDLQGIPFVGPAGKFLDDMLSIIDVDRNNCYIANIVKCRPPRNRDPEPEEQNACVEYLVNQIKLVDPKIIICLGRIAAKYMISPQYKITEEHGKWILADGYWVTAIYHPSALLRNPERRPETFADLLSIRRMIEKLGCDMHK